MKNKRILVFTLLMSALLVFSAMPAFSADDEVNFEEPEFYVAESSTVESGTQADALTEADKKTSADLEAAAEAGTTVAKVYYVEDITSSTALTKLINLLASVKTETFKLESTIPANSELDLSETSIKYFTIAAKAAVNVTSITLPDTIEEFDGSAIKVTKITIPSGMKKLTLNNVTTITTLDLTGATGLTHLSLAGAKGLEELDLSKNTELTNLGLSGAISLKALVLTNLTKLVNLEIANLEAAGENITLPADNDKLETLDISGNQFWFLNAKKKYTSLSSFTGGTQSPKRTSVKASGALFNFASKFGFSGSGNDAIDYSNITSVTATDSDSSTFSGSMDEDGLVSWTNGTPTGIKTITYVYSTMTTASEAETAAESSMTVEATLSGKAEETGTVGGSGGGCSAGFGALALAAVAAFLLKKSR